MTLSMLFPSEENWINPEFWFFSSGPAHHRLISNLEKGIIQNLHLATNVNSAQFN